MNNTCSHVLISVRDLHRAVRDYRALGFEVEYATKERDARHAHVWFGAGPILELITTPTLARWFKWPIEWYFGRGAGRRMTRWAARAEGFCDVALVTDSPRLELAVDALEARGIPFGRVVPWRRVKPDGQTVCFAFAYPTTDSLPFLVSPYAPPQHPKEPKHPNGATRIARLWLGFRPEDEAALRAIVGDDPTFVLEPASTTAVRAVELDGLTRPLEPSLLHGAALRSSRAPEMTARAREAS